MTLGELVKEQVEAQRELAKARHKMDAYNQGIEKLANEYGAAHHRYLTACAAVDRFILAEVGG